MSRHVTVSFLSFPACIDLGLLPNTFPEVGSCDKPAAATASSVTSSSPNKCSNSGVPLSSSQSTCSCPRRAAPPTTPPILPCAPTPENVPVLKQYILDRYSSSAFNCCEHQPLKLMENSPPLTLVIQEAHSCYFILPTFRFPQNEINSFKSQLRVSGLLRMSL